MAKLTYTGAEVQALLDKVNEYADLSGVVTLDGDQEITGLKAFVNGLKIGAGESAPHVKYKEVNGRGVLVFPCDVLFERGLAWNSSLNGFNPQTITQAVSVDGKTLKYDAANGYLYVAEGAGGVDEDYLSNILSDYAKTADVNSLLTEYLPKSGGTVNGDITATKFIGDLQGNADSATLWTQNSVYVTDFDALYARNNGLYHYDGAYDSLIGKPPFDSRNFSLLNIGASDGRRQQLAIPYNDNRMFLRVSIDRVWRDWREFAFLDSTMYPTGDIAMQFPAGEYIDRWGNIVFSPAGGAWSVMDNNRNNKFVVWADGRVNTSNSLTSNGPIYFGETETYGENTSGLFRIGKFDENGGLKLQFGADSNAHFAIVNRRWDWGLFDIDSSGNVVAAGNITATKFIGNLTGTADSATLWTKNSVYVVDFDALYAKNNGLYHYDGAYDSLVGRPPFYSQHFTLLNMGASDGRRQQLVIPYNDNRMFLRVKTDRVWQDWREFAFIDSDSLSPISGTLAVNGNILATGEVVWNSSRVLKTEIKEHYLSLEQLAQIKPYSYKWKDGRDNLVHVGAIADEVMEPLPETVLTDTRGIHSMDYGQTAFVMAASLTPHVSDLERRMKFLERICGVKA